MLAWLLAARWRIHVAYTKAAQCVTLSKQISLLTEMEDLLFLFYRILLFRVKNDGKLTKFNIKRQRSGNFEQKIDKRNQFA